MNSGDNNKIVSITKMIDRFVINVTNDITKGSDFPTILGFEIERISENIFGLPSIDISFDCKENGLSVDDGNVYDLFYDMLGLCSKYIEYIIVGEFKLEVAFRVDTPESILYVNRYHTYERWGVYTKDDYIDSMRKVVRGDD